VRPPRPDIAVPPFPASLEWVGEPVESVDRLVAARPALVHFFDFAQLNSVRALPYLRAWRERYRSDGLEVIGVHSPRFPFTQGAGAVAGACGRLEIDWPVAVDDRFASWKLYEPHGWPALFLWGQGGALRWYHLGEGDYADTEREIQRALAPENGREWPQPVEPIRPSDAPDARVIPPTAEVFPGGSTQEPWVAGESGTTIEVEYEAGGAYAATDGTGEIAIRVDGEEPRAITVSHAGLQELTLHERTERRSVAIEPSPGLRVYSIQFAAGVPAGD
jgi:hypothetical protein